MRLFETRMANIWCFKVHAFLLVIYGILFVSVCLFPVLSDALVKSLLCSFKGWISVVFFPHICNSSTLSGQWALSSGWSLLRRWPSNIILILSFRPINQHHTEFPGRLNFASRVCWLCSTITSVRTPGDPVVILAERRCTLITWRESDRLFLSLISINFVTHFQNSPDWNVLSIPLHHELMRAIKLT